MKDSFLTIDAGSEGLFKDRGSKFLSFAYPVKSEEEVRMRLEALRKKYHDARHHCYAWRLKTDHSMYRANDDGEPSNSAGKPILNQIESRDLTNVLVVVIRYFGGTLLGVGGLINAYRSSAAEALDKSKIVKKYIYRSFQVSFEYALMNEVMKILKERGLENYDQQFELSCTLKIDVRIDQVEKVMDAFGLLNRCKLEEL